MSPRACFHRRGKRRKKKKKSISANLELGARDVVSLVLESRRPRRTENLAVGAQKLLCADCEPVARTDCARTLAASQAPCADCRACLSCQITCCRSFLTGDLARRALRMLPDLKLYTKSIPPRLTSVIAVTSTACTPASTLPNKQTNIAVANEPHSTRAIYTSILVGCFQVSFRQMEAINIPFSWILIAFRQSHVLPLQRRHRGSWAFPPCSALHGLCNNAIFLPGSQFSSSRTVESLHSDSLSLWKFQPSS